MNHINISFTLSPEQAEELLKDHNPELLKILALGQEAPRLTFSIGEEGKNGVSKVLLALLIHSWANRLYQEIFNLNKELPETAKRRPLMTNWGGKEFPIGLGQAVCLDGLRGLLEEIAEVGRHLGTIGETEGSPLAWIDVSRR